MQLLLSQPPVDLDSPVVAQAVIDPALPAVGELIVWRITLNALEASVRWPALLPEVPGLEIKPSSAGQILPMVAGVQKPITARNFHLRAQRAGFYSIPAFDVEAYGKRITIPVTAFEVTQRKRPGSEPARQAVLRPGRTNLFVGETIPVTVLLPGNSSNVVSGLSQLNFAGEGIIGPKNATRQLVEQREVNGRRTATVVYESTITAISAGPAKVSVYGFSAGMFFTGPVVLQGNVSFPSFGGDNVLVDSEALTIHVQPLPTISETQGFTGYIGSLEIEKQSLSTNSLRVGDALRMIVTFRGDATAGRLVPPGSPRVGDWQIFPPVPVEPPRPQRPDEMLAAFAFTMIPVTDETKQTPAIPFHVFDPNRAAFVDMTIPSLPVKVNAEGLPTNWVEEVSALMAETPGVKRARLGEIARTRGIEVKSLRPLQERAAFVAMQTTPVVLLLAAWGWERRRKFLVAHPEIVRRRAAKRALRRQRKLLRRAAGSGDELTFAREAVTAMRIAAAPHFPAETRAMVCDDVLSVMPQYEQIGRGGELVREFFEMENAQSFSREPARGSDLIQSKPEVESLLTTMEERL